MLQCYRVGPLVSGFVLIVSQLPADTVSWINPDGDNWNTAANWSPAVVPNNSGGTSYDVGIGPISVPMQPFPSFPSVAVNTSPTINSLILNGTSAEVLAGRTLTTGTLNLQSEAFAGGVGSITVDSGGTLNASTVFLPDDLAGFIVNGTATIGTLNSGFCPICPNAGVGPGGLLNVGNYNGGGIMSVKGTLNLGNTNLNIAGPFTIDGGSVTVGREISHYLHPQIPWLPLDRSSQIPSG